MNINFPTQTVLKCYHSYTQHVFTLALTALEKNSQLTKDEQKLLILTKKHLLPNPKLFTHPSIIYLSNGLLDLPAKDCTQTKNQLFLELALRLLYFKKVKQISCPQEKGFSILLNQPITHKFDAIERKQNKYLFFFKTKHVLTLCKNTNCIISKGVDFLLEDHNPLHQKNDHPNQPFVKYTLGGKTLQLWLTQFKNAYTLIKKYSPKTFLEISPFLNQIIPLGYIPEKQISSSYTLCPGILYLSYTDKDLTQAEALIHEINHTIFNLIEKNHPFLKNNNECKYYSAYRPDARHFRGCFLGLHAFVAVQHFYHEVAQKNKSSQLIFATLFFKNTLEIQVMEKYGLFTQEGKKMYADIKKVFASNIPYYKKLCSNNPALIKKAKTHVMNHFKKAKKDNKILLY